MTTFQDAHELLGDLSLDDLRILRQHLTDEESRVSYWRRLFQARLDMLHDGDLVDTQDVRAVLQDASSAPRRWQALGLHPADIDTSMPEAQSLWSRVVNLNDDEQRRAYIDVLQAMETALSTNRRALHHQIDAVTEELITRYRTNPALALTALPVRRR
jgi:RsiG-like